MPFGIDSSSCDRGKTGALHRAFTPIKCLAIKPCDTEKETVCLGRSSIRMTVPHAASA